VHSVQTREMVTGGDEREETALAAVTFAAARLGLDPADATVVRRGTAVLVELPGARALARVDDGAGRAERQVRVAAALAAAGIPAVRLVGDGEQPVSVHGLDVTCWHLEDLGGPTVTPAMLGRLARRLHDATGLESARRGVPAFDPFAAIAEQLSAAEGADRTPPDELLVLRTTLGELAASWPEVVAADPQGICLVHGDLHPDNVLATPDGPRLADLELAGVGPASYDLATQVVGVRRYGADPAELDEFLGGYGAALPTAEVLEPMVAVVELWVTAWAVAHRGIDDAHEAEAVRRTGRWRGDEPAEPWTVR